MGYAKTRKCIVMCVFPFLFWVGRSKGRKMLRMILLLKENAFANANLYICIG